jgi:hypothetical protein
MCGVVETLGEGGVGDGERGLWESVEVCVKGLGSCNIGRDARILRALGWIVRGGWCTPLGRATARMDRYRPQAWYLGNCYGGVYSSSNVDVFSPFCVIHVWQPWETQKPVYLVACRGDLRKAVWKRALELS